MTKKMKPQILLCAILTTVALGGNTSEVKDKPYYVFRSDCPGDHSHGDEGEEVYGSPSSWGSSGNAGYRPYTGNNGYRQRALGEDGEDGGDSWGGSSGKNNGYFFSKCSKYGGRTWSKSSKTKSSKSKSSKSKSSKSTSSSTSHDGPYFHVHPRPPSPPSTPTGPSAPYVPYTARPTSPTQKPTPKSPGTKEVSSCEALSQGDVVYASDYAMLEYTYEAAVSEDVEVESVTLGLEKKVTLYVGNELMGCDDSRRRSLQQEQEQEQRQSRRFLGGLEIVGVDHSSPGDEIADGESCSYFIDDNNIDDTDCYVVNGGMTLYFRSDEDGDWRRRLSASEDEEFMEESTSNALNLIMEAMNEEDPSPFLEESDGKYSVPGLMGVRFISGTTFDGEEIVAESEDDQGRGGQIDGIQEGEQGNIQTSKMTKVGGALLGIGLAALLALALMLVVRKRRQTPPGEKYNKFDEDNENDLDDENTDVDAQSLKSSIPPTPTRSRQAYVVGEEGSLYTSATHDTRVLHNSLEYGNGNDDDQQVDVHHCTSAMCPICNGKETVFVNAVDDDDNDREIQMEEYEMGYDPSATVRRSFEYEPKEDVSTPSFDNPAEIERPYVVDDTIDF